ncbi:MAG TPA: PQQ-binding-like beta-propeller repeat protein [Tepidisphaeraceae bacterium]|jgi:hypothetical protein|nr:PQQ-binding-like beta-propeller repeat protein [Tepidisphaeraceae bacterium]
MRTTFVSVAGLLLALTASARAGNWPTWRGVAGDGVSNEKQVPTSWSATENITWKSPLPGGGNSTPIVWGDSVFVTCASKQGAVRSVICFDRATGTQRWSADTQFKGVEPTHADNPYCASSPIADGKAVYAWLGSAGVVAYDLSGKPLWKGRAAGSTWGSTVLADGRFFTTDQSGQTTVWSAGDALKIQSQNPLNEKTRATPVFSDGQIFIRTYENLYCIGKRK